VSATSNIITIIICVILVAAIGFALVKGIWSAARKITVPIQIVLFVVMLVCVCQLFCTKENAQKLYNGIEQTGISQNMEATMRSALKLKPAETFQSDAKPAQVAETPVAASIPETEVKPVQKSVPATSPSVVNAEHQVEKAPAPAAANVEVNVTPPAQSAQQSVTESESKPEKLPDFSHLNKGKKTFMYALPFNAKVVVGFKDNAYRVTAESLGDLEASEKKEIGKMIFMALGEYVGKKIVGWDKSKISIESRYDDSNGYTHVFAIIPPDAID